MKMQKINFVPVVYGIYFAVFVVILSVVLYAPVWLATVMGLIISFFGSFITDKMLQKYIKKNNPFLAVRDMGKSLVLAFVPPNRILMFAAKKDIGKNKIRIQILKDGKYEEYEHFLVPNQEFQLEPKIELNEKYSIYELLENPYVIWELEEPLKQTFNIEPFGIETVVLVYPTEIITQEQLKFWNLDESGVKTERIPVEKNGKIIEHQIAIPIYSPKPYAINSDNIKQLSANHRLSQISTILEQTRDILKGAETIAAGGIHGMKAGIGNIFALIKRNPTILIVILLLLGGLVFGISLMRFSGLFQAKTSSAMTTLLKNATKFP